MKAWRHVGGWTVLGGCLLMAAAEPAPAGRSGVSPRPEFRFHGAVIRVTDMDRALAFYTEALGFAVDSDGGTPRTVRLGGEFPLYLRRVPPAPDGRTRNGSGQGLARSGITFQTSDIGRRTEALRAADVEFLADEPHRVGVGLAIFFRDPFGTVHSLLEETVGEAAPVTELKVYNSGFSHPDVGKTRPLYVETLGFVVRTEKYFPPALPLGHADGSFAFMLHEEADLHTAASGYPKGPGTTLVFTVRDGVGAAAYLRSRGVNVFRPGPAAPRGVVAFRDAYGVVSEIWPGSAAPEPALP